MIDVSCTVKVYELDGDELAFFDHTHDIIINSHWSRNEMVVLLLEGKKYTVAASDLNAAIKNATNK